MIEDNIKIIISSDEADIRIDKLVSILYNQFSRSQIQKFIKNGDLTINKNFVKPSYITKENDEVIFSTTSIKKPEILPNKDIPLNILYEDESILIVDKAKNVPVHPSIGHYDDTLVNALLFHCKKLSDINGELRPGIVHRIDKNTTGALIICKNNDAHISVAKQLKSHSIKRRYIGIVKGILNNYSDTINLPIGRDKKNRLKMSVNLSGKEAITNYRVLEYLDNATLVEFYLNTGRTHQIRVHTANMNHPLLGDSLYGECKYTNFTNEQCLHAYMIGFIHPNTGEYMEFYAQIPEYMHKLNRKLGGKFNFEDLLNYK